ncbi:MAG: thiamine pyrophosphate-binding protein [Promethearchaeota archaeon]|jgi:acetolactate synthase-1/2/3 large subunit
MVKVNGAQLVVRALDHHGVKVIFTLCGDNTLIYHYCQDSSSTELGIDLIDFRHEQATGHAAMGYYLATGEPGVCSVPSGPGVIDLFPSIPLAMDASIPIVAVCTSTPLRLFDKLPHNEVDVVPSLRPVTKWSGYCYETARIPEYINMAFRIATTGRPGPVVLVIPSDILSGGCDDELDIVKRAFKPVQKLRSFYGPYGNENIVSRAADLLLSAKNPLIIAGTGAAFSDASLELLKFAELTQIPVGSWGFGLGEFPVDHPLFFGPATPIEGPGTALLSQVDTVLILGSRMSEYMSYGYMPHFKDDTLLIQVDIKAEEIGRNRAIDLPIVGDVKGVLTQLYKIASEKIKTPRVETEWVKTIQNQLKNFEARIEKEGSSDKIPIQPQRLVKEIRDFMPKDSVIILDGGDTTVWGLIYLRAHSPKSLYFSGGLGIQHLGGGVPMAIAAKYVDPERKILVLTGDGSFLFNGKELDTAKRFDLPFTVVVSNDSLWGMVARGQKMVFGKKFFGLGSSLSSDTRYDKYAEAFNCHGELVTDPNEIGPALQRAFDSNVPAVIDVRIDPKVNTILTYLAKPKRTPKKKKEVILEVAPIKK